MKRKLSVFILTIVMIMSFTTIINAKEANVLSKTVNDAQQETNKTVLVKIMKDNHDEIKDSVEGFTKKVNNTIEKEKKKKAEKERREKERKTWKSIGDCRITYYCPACNDPAGSYQSSSGATLYEGCVACSWLPIGTKLKINGNEYTVMDTCGTDAIDIFVDTSYCQCDGNYYTEVFVKND